MIRAWREWDSAQEAQRSPHTAISALSGIGLAESVFGGPQAKYGRSETRRTIYRRGKPILVIIKHAR